MREVYVVSDNITSPLGSTTGENFTRVSEGVSGIASHDDASLSEQPFYASLFHKSDARFRTDDQYTRFEKLLISSISAALQDAGVDVTDKKTVLVLSSTKGNIELLENAEADPGSYKRISLSASAKKIADHFGFVNPPVIVSNACISGLLGILTAKRLLSSGQYDAAVVAGADMISKFILSGFQSFQAVSPEPCRPFDRDRKGITLGEGAATIIMSADQKNKDCIQVSGGGAGNDANHISAPSRTGEELSFIIGNALRESGLSKNDIGFISAHGTATIYNDEMEAKAIAHAGMRSFPVNSLKGYFGHTLGAAGLIESIMSIQSIKHGVILPTHGFRQPDESIQLNISNKIQTTSSQGFLKTASGFGGCNAAIVFRKTAND